MERKSNQAKLFFYNFIYKLSSQCQIEGEVLYIVLGGWNQLTKKYLPGNAYCIHLNLHIYPSISVMVNIVPWMLSVKMTNVYVDLDIVEMATLDVTVSFFYVLYVCDISLWRIGLWYKFLLGLHKHWSFSQTAFMAQCLPLQISCAEINFYWRY
jgi:hypothetical protein